MIIRPATHADADAICAIWNVYIRDTTVTFTTTEKTSADICAYIDARQSGGKAVFVAEDERGVEGFAASSEFRSGPGYAQVLENSVMLTAQASAKGTGRALMQAIEKKAKEGGIHALVAGISGDNDAAIAFHAAIGFEEVGRMPEVGTKFGRRLDLVLMQKRL